MGRLSQQLLLSFLAQSGLVRDVAAMFYYPDVQTSQLEHILVDNWGAYASNYSSAITPCDRYVTEIGDSAVKSGRTTSAQWLRVLFHDFATAHVEEGLGGIDASIGFETYRDENKGSAFNDSFVFWRPFANEFISMADLLAIGTPMSVGLCGNGTIPFRAGRVDATSEDSNTGVPEPGTSLEETLKQFELNGFNQEDAIALTACGHTLGSAHHSGFPEVSDNSTLSENNTNGGINFDSSRGMFDTLIVEEYLEGTGQRGGPLVTSFNETSRSDLRLFESDGNATMKALHAQGEGFIDTCVDLLARVMNTVPAGVELKEDPIEPMAVKPVNVTWDITEDGGLELSGRIRILQETAQAKQPITITFSNGYNETLTPEEETGVSVFGETQYAPFAIAHSKINGSTSFAVNTDSTEFAIQDSYVVVPSQSTVVDASSVKVTVAVREGAEDAGLSVLATVPVVQPLTVAPKMVSTEIALEKSAASAPAGFALWEGSVAIDSPPTGAVSVRLVQDGGETLDTLLLDAGVASW